MPVKKAYARWMTQKELNKASQVANYLNIRLEILDEKDERLLVQVGNSGSNLSQFWTEMRGHLR